MLRRGNLSHKFGGGEEGETEREGEAEGEGAAAYGFTLGGSPART